MPDQSTVPYGSWPSPIAASALAADTVGLSQVLLDVDSGLFWLESRPSEGGRVALVHRRPDGQLAEVTPASANVRSRVHEYGGGAATVRGELVVYSEFADNRLYRLQLAAGADTSESAPAAASPVAPGGDLRYADLHIDPVRDRLICVREDHRGAGECTNTLVSLDLTADADNADGGTVLVDGFDFVASPQLSPSGDRLAWLVWNHPNMPWDGTTLFVAPVQPDGRLGHWQQIAGGERESIFAPRWLADDRLVYCSDRTGWGNLYVQSVAEDGRSAGQARPLHPAPAEFAAPAWSLGESTYDVIDAHRLACSWTADGVAGLGVLDVDTGQVVAVQPAPAAVDDVRAIGGLVACVVGRTDSASALVCFDPARADDPAAVRVVREASSLRLPSAGISVARPVSWPSLDGATAYGYFYPPANAEVAGPPDERPPLLVLSHGGPTGATSPAMSLSVQFWTSRGFAVLDVDYGGSTGYGRAYRDRLTGRWGIVDVADCCAGARYATDQGWVDGARMAIKGGSAGGYTTLSALTFTDVFAAGASRYGIGDLEALARDTHKFESRYLDGLVGPYPADAQVYRERSPIHHVDRLDCALLLLQGTEDRVVPPAQAVEMADAVRAKGKPVALVMFDGEGHGFRQRANIERTFEAELYFFGRVFGFTPAGFDPKAPAPIELENAPDNRPSA